MSADSSRWDEAAVRVLDLLSRGRTEEAFAFLEAAASDAPPVGPPPGFREVAGALYWKHKALAESAVLSREIERRLEAALNSGGEGPDERLVRPLAGTAYNLASFCWPGWDEPGIAITPELLADGRAAAHRALAIRCDPRHQEMAFGFSVAMARWMVGAYYLADGDFSAARLQFAEAAHLNAADGKEEILERGYVCLADFLANPSARGPFQAVLDELAASPGEDAAFFREQLVTAERVFTR